MRNIAHEVGGLERKSLRCQLKKKKKEEERKFTESQE